MTYRSGLLAVLAVVLLVMGFTTRAPAPGRRIPVRDDRSGTRLAARQSARHTSTTLPARRPEAMGSERSLAALLASAEDDAQTVALVE